MANGPMEDISRGTDTARAHEDIVWFPYKRRMTCRMSLRNSPRRPTTRLKIQAAEGSQMK